MDFGDKVILGVIVALAGTLLLIAIPLIVTMWRMAL